MEKSYMCYEQISQMQASYDAFACVKITHDAGVDVVKNSIKFYCNNYGDQASVFWDCMKLIFGDVVHTSEGLNQWGTSKNTYRVPLPELREFYPLLKDEERDRYIDKFHKMLRSTDDYFCEFEMEGMMAGNCFYITFMGEYGSYSPLLANMVAIRNEIRELIRARREQLVNGLRNVVLAKMVYDRLGLVVDVPLDEDVNVVFSRIMDQCGNLSISLAAGDPFSYESMLTLLNSVLDQAAIKTKREDVAA